MTKWAVPHRPTGPLDDAREALGKAGACIASISGSGPKGLEILYLLDTAASRIEDAEAAGADVRAERGRLETAWSSLRRQARVFIREVGPALADARAHRESTHPGPWWTLDLEYARMQRRSLGRAALGALTVVLLLGISWLVYEHFIAPPPEIRQAFTHIARGEERATQGDLTGALEEFEAAAALAPNEIEPHLWLGVLRQSTGDGGGAQAAYDSVRALGLEERELLLERGSLFLQLGNLEAAQQDAQAAIQLAPEWGYGHYLRASVEEAAGEIEAAIDDYRVAADLAREAEDAELEAAARVQMGLLIQYQP